MAAHQCDAISAKALREVTRLRHVGHEQVGVAEIVGDVPDRHLGADEASRMNDRPQLCLLGDAERQGVLGMGMDDGHDVRPCRENRPVDEALEVKAAVLVAHRLTVQVELDNVIWADQLRRERSGDQEAVGIVGMGNADVAVGVDDLFPSEDPVSDHEVFDQRIEIAHRARPFYSPTATGRPRCPASRNIALIRCGVAGSWVTPPGAPIASSIAAAMTAPTPLIPPSPTLLMPSGLSGLGASSVTNTSTAGVSRTVGSR